MIRRAAYILVLLLCGLAAFAQKPAPAMDRDLFKSVRGLPAYGLPYGSELLRRIPKDIDQSQLRAAIDSLSIGLYRDLAAPARKSVPVKSLPMDALFPVSYLRKYGLQPVKDTGRVSLMKIREAGKISVYSVTVQQDISCPACEYQPRQLLHMLFTLTGDQLTGRLLIAFVKGDDLARRERYFYIDARGNIFLKDYSSDELRSVLLNSSRWLMAPGGQFRKVK